MVDLNLSPNFEGCAHPTKLLALLLDICWPCHYGREYQILPQIMKPFCIVNQRYTYRVLQTIQMKLILLWVWAEQAVLGRAKTALKFKYEI